VERGKGLELLAALGDVDAAIGQHAVHIEDRGLDAKARALRFEQQLGRKLERGLHLQMTFARMRSLIEIAPISLASASTTSTTVMRASSIRSAASTASASALTVRGFTCMTSAAFSARRSWPFSTRRRRSPSVKMP